MRAWHVLTAVSEGSLAVPASDTTGLVPGCGFSPAVCLNTSRETVVVLLPSLRENGHAVREVQFCLVVSQRNLVCFANKLLFIGLTSAACSCFSRLEALFQSLAKENKEMCLSNMSVLQLSYTSLAFG